MLSELNQAEESVSQTFVTDNTQSPAVYTVLLSLGNDRGWGMLIVSFKHIHQNANRILQMDLNGLNATEIQNC